MIAVVNDLGDSAKSVTDFSYVDDLSSQHVLTSIKTCSSQVNIVGIQVTYDAWSKTDSSVINPG